MKAIAQHLANEYGRITVQFADRCHEYKSAGIRLIPTTLKTGRLGFHTNYGIVPATLQYIKIYDIVEKVSKETRYFLN